MPNPTNSGSLKKANEKRAEISRNKKDIFLSALKKSLGNRTISAEKAGISRKTFNDWYRDDSEFKQKVDEIDEYQIDFVESKLMENINSNETTSIIFFLKTRGKGRGYVEKVQTELSTSKSDPVVINYVMPSVNNSNKQD